MRKILLPLLFFFATASLSSAQVKNGLNYEVGGGFLYNRAYVTDGPTKAYGPGVYFEMRDKFDSNFDVGGLVNYHYSNGSGYMKDWEERLVDVNCHQVEVKGVGDYNILPDSLVNPYLGLELGLGLMYSNWTENVQSLFMYQAFGLRLGVQIWHFRLSCYADFNLDWRKVNGVRYCNTANIGVNLGFAF